MEKISDAEDIFERKHRIVEEKLEGIVSKIEEDKRMQKDLKEMREQEITMMKDKVESYFVKERPKRKELES